MQTVYEITGDLYWILTNTNAEIGYQGFDSLTNNHYLPSNVENLVHSVKKIYQICISLLL